MLAGRDGGPGRGLGQASQQQSRLTPDEIDALDLSPSRIELRRLGELPVYEIAALLIWMRPCQGCSG